MAKKARVTRKKLLKEPDEFITTTGRFIQWSRHYQTQLSYAVGAFFILLAAIAGLRYFSNQAENKAFELLSQATHTYESRLKAVGPEKAYQEVKEAFEYILNNYKRKTGGKMARLIYADISYNAGNADQAVLFYEQALKDLAKEQSFRNFILSSLGYAYEKKQEYRKAISYFEEITQSNDPLIKDLALFNQGRLYGMLGDASKSKDAFSRLVSDHTDSIYIEIAKEKIAG
jgi:tetratricopeptide (TPR) repeat protein